ncbi:MAG TPA: hypothetical protein PLI45_01095 [Candidatus Woesebacteria bacterium]|nr:hypothetical protein [Candidatus Woesebacteria bacterium]
MITILHGEDVQKSYQRLFSLTDQLKLHDFEILVHEASEIDITGLRQEIGSYGLFGSSKCFVIKNLISGQKSKNKAKIIELINQNEDSEIILWDDKTLTPSSLKQIPSAKTEIFPISPVIFKFLDSLKPGNTQTILLSWKNILQEGTEPDFVFAMMVRQIKLLIQAKAGSKNLKLAPYPARLIQAQSVYFSLDQLLDLYQRLADIDVKIKTGTSTANSEQLLGHFLQKI